MRIGLHDAEKDHFKKKHFPNLALMKISAWHKAQGDSVEWWDPIEKYDQIYSSKVFDFTPENLYLPTTTIRGGTGYTGIRMNHKLPEEIDDLYPDYSIYPGCDYAIGYITRGCPNKCPWCYVPEKEGNIKAYRQWQKVIRTDSKKLILMDNNILASEYGIGQLENMIGTDYEIDLNQGMDARLVNNEIANILSKLKWIRFIRFSCDQTSQIPAILDAAELLLKHGVRPYRLFIYLLVKKDIDDAAFRVEKLKHLKAINLYAQPERNERKGIIPNSLQLEFAQRYVYGGCYRKETWEEYVSRKNLI
ncbi:radical SAM protein [Desulfosporosinus sp. FKA]|uniref:radical SAM protein n=1 Tax=Desulfosporosinus sp. FKA TaxID=1969834 RepID=UPI000B4A06A6|nr:radical SAM protein [Desulfosporosinus sp. FKA]